MEIPNSPSGVLADGLLRRQRMATLVRLGIRPSGPSGADELPDLAQAASTIAALPGTISVIICCPTPRNQTYQRRMLGWLTFRSFSICLLALPSGLIRCRAEFLEERLSPLPPFQQRTMVQRDEEDTR